MASIKIDYEISSKIIVETLKEDYTSLCEQIVALKRKKKAGIIKTHEKEDLDYNKKFRKGIEISLSYYMPFSEAEQFIKRVKKNTKHSFSSWDDF
jgi:hypothetical protein